MLTLTDPLVVSIIYHQIKKIIIDLELNEHIITVADYDVDDNEIRRRDLSLQILDDFNTVIVPPDWPETNPTGEELYQIIQQFLYLSLQNEPGANGLGAGTIS